MKTCTVEVTSYEPSGARIVDNWRDAVDYRPLNGELHIHYLIGDVVTTLATYPAGGWARARIIADSIKETP